MGKIVTTQIEKYGGFMKPATKDQWRDVFRRYHSTNCIEYVNKEYYDEIAFEFSMKNIIEIERALAYLNNHNCGRVATIQEWRNAFSETFPTGKKKKVMATSYHPYQEVPPEIKKRTQLEARNTRHYLEDIAACNRYAMDYPGKIQLYSRKNEE